MIRYYCDRCGTEIRKEQFDMNPHICQFREDKPQFGAIKFTMIQSDCKLCVDCMRKYINFLKGGDLK